MGASSVRKRILRVKKIIKVFKSYKNVIGSNFSFLLLLAKEIQQGIPLFVFPRF